MNRHMCKNTYAFVVVNLCLTLCYVLDGKQKVAKNVINFRILQSV